MSDDVKRMADLLKSGATMLSDVCPNCGSPLFKVKGEIFCAKCNKPVVHARATGPQATVSASMLLESVEQTVIGKISETNELLKLEKDPERLSAYSNLVFGWLSMLEKLTNLKKSIPPEQVPDSILQPATSLVVGQVRRRLNDLRFLRTMRLPKLVVVPASLWLSPVRQEKEYCDDRCQN